MNDVELEKLMREAPDYQTPYVCVRCGAVDYAMADDEIHQCDNCGRDMLPVRKSDLMHDWHEPDEKWDVVDLPVIRNRIREEEGDRLTGTPVYLSVCPNCGGYCWNRHGRGVSFCGRCENDSVIIDTFVL